MKCASILAVIYLVNCQFAVATDSAATENTAGALHSQIKYVESEMMRVWVTIDALVDEIGRSSVAMTDEMHKSLANLYFYDCELTDYLGELKTELNQRDNPSLKVFPETQFEPIQPNTMTLKLPSDAFPILGGPKIKIEMRGQ